MIELNLSDLNQEKVYLLSIHSSGMVRYYNSINAYRQKKKPKILYVKKSIFKNLIKNRMYSVSELSYTVPRICYINKLKDEVVSLSIFDGTKKVYSDGRLKVLSSEEYAEQVNNFCESNKKAFEILGEAIKKEFGETNLYTDGDFIFDLKLSSINGADINNDDGKFISLNDDNSLILGGFKGVSFDLLADVNGKIDEKNYLKRRYVLIYSVLNPEDNKLVKVYLPSSSEKFATKETFKNIVKEKFINLRFLTSFVKKYSKLFDYQDMEILGIEETILDLGVLTLNQIDDYQYDYYVYSHEFTPIIAWLARLAHKSTNIAQLNAVKRSLYPLVKEEKQKISRFSGSSNVLTTSYEKMNQIKTNQNTPDKLDISKYLNIEKSENYDLKLKIQQELFESEKAELNRDIQEYYEEYE